MYVTQLLSAATNIPDGNDNAKFGKVTVISTQTDNIIATVRLNPIADTGFKALGDAITRIPPPAVPTPADFKFTTGAYPNQLQDTFAIKGRFAFVPSTGSSPNGPVRFDVNTQSLLCVIDTLNNQDAGRTINMHLAVNQQTNSGQVVHYPAVGDGVEAQRRRRLRNQRREQHPGKSENQPDHRRGYGGERSI